METQLKHFEATMKLQDDLFRLKREEQESAARLDRSVHESVDQRLR